MAPASGALRALTVATPAGFAVGDWPFSPPPGASEARVAVPTRACVRPAPGALDSHGAPITTTCNGAPGWLSNFSSGAAVAAGALFVSMSNLGSNPGRPDTQFLPGSVLVFDLDVAAARVEPTAILATSGFNPTHVTAYRAPNGRAFVLVSVSGALGLRPDDPATPEREAGGAALSPSAIDVIDAAERRVVATIPLGLAGASFDRLAIDPTGRVAVVGSAIGRRLLAVDLAPLGMLALAPGAPPLVLDGSSGPDAVIFDATAPLELPARANGAPPATCPGFVVGADFDAAGTKLFATDFCDGTLAIVGVDLASGPAPLPPSRFRVLDSIAIAAPLDTASLGLARAPGALRVRPGRPGRGLPRAGRRVLARAAGGGAVRRSHRLALSVAALLAASAVGGVALRLGVAAAAASGRGAGSGAVAPAGTASGAALGDGAGRAARDAHDPHAAGATAPATGAAARVAPPPPAAPTAPPPITLDDPRALGVAVVLAGRDPDAPRPLDLWRIDANGRAARVARGRSAPDGSLAFGPLVLPARAIELVATPRGGSPRDAGASRPVIVRRDPAAPRVAAAWQGDGLVLRVHAAESGGALVVEQMGVAGADATPLARVELEARADAVPAPVEIELADARGAPLQVVQIDPEGRRSAPRPVYLDDEDNQPTQE